MSAKIRLFDETEATCTDGEWKSRSFQWERALNNTVDILGPSGGDSNWDLTCAQNALKLFGGELLEFDEPEIVEGRVY